MVNVEHRDLAYRINSIEERVRRSEEILMSRIHKLEASQPRPRNKDTGHQDTGHQDTVSELLNGVYGPKPDSIDEPNFVKNSLMVLNNMMDRINERLDKLEEPKPVMPQRAREIYFEENMTVADELRSLRGYLDNLYDLYAHNDKRLIKLETTPVGLDEVIAKPTTEWSKPTNISKWRAAGHVREEAVDRCEKCGLKGQAFHKAALGDVINGPMVIRCYG